MCTWPRTTPGSSPWSTRTRTIPPSPAHLLARNPHACALGKLLLAEEPERRYRRDELARLTENTVCDPTALLAELATAADTGLAKQCGELHPSTGCLAVPVPGPADGALVAGLALSGPAWRVAEPNTELVELLREHAARLAPLLA